ncbi:hypothetical protein [Sphingomonas sp.]|jgi:hypothetical protein|uniref:hypothetical protein n=1 Tax=Sphingomonas sp. TaxID=28214 RepID=UPI002E37F7D2|nr:hypothetical protein [Sphingomonas sp.]HEX4694513.1 hypothetical protein [Sphingomonas sp.]
MNQPMDPVTAKWFAIVFPACFVAFWLLIVTMLGFISGWFTLQRRYPRGPGGPIRTFRMKSGSMGRFGLGRVSMNGILNLAPTHNGLRVGVFRLFGPFQRPFEVPWNEIQVERRTRFLVPGARLTFGIDEGNLTLAVGLWNRIVDSAPERERPRLSVEPVAAQALAAALLGAWIAISALVGTFIAVTSRAGTHPSPVPLAICYGVPAFVVGIGMFGFWMRTR